ncbi:hypothetical protein PsorP6_003404 [Peronosclerospora sorghi]|uniref:Uncharacterized protein n=1 Tax=Peronosclerospora sorghi TaxID=230839 RepID=A0ACC0VM73_9STRA|nr:hypothetical protein PsorP6_003404 [Peronosclerospora sorghi]
MSLLRLSWLRSRSILQARYLSIDTPSFVFQSRHEYMEYLQAHQSRLPWGFSVATTTFGFIPQEAPHLPSNMTMTLIKCVRPTPLFAAVFTQNAFPGAPVLVGRKRLQEPQLGAILINNKISNVCANGGGVADAEEVCDQLAKHLRLASGTQILPCSTGVIGWRIPVDAMVENLPKLVKNLQADTILPAAEGIMTTDLSIPREVLRQILKEAVEDTYNSLSVDTDQSTSDTVALVSSDQIPFDLKDLDVFKEALRTVCLRLSEDIVRNAEGAHHVIRVRVAGTLSKEMAKGVGKSVVNSPLLKCAVAGNDPNVGRLVMAVGKYMGLHHKDVNIQRRMKIRMGGVVIFENGEMVLNDDIEAKLVAHMRDAMLIEPTRGGLDASSHNFPPHGKFVEIEVDLGVGSEETQVLGIDLTHEYLMAKEV